MIAFEIKLNGKHVALAGREDLCVLHAIVDAVGVLGGRSNGTIGEKEGYGLELFVGGLTAKDDDSPDEHLRWQQARLSMGDEITIRVLDTDEAEPPTSAAPSREKPDAQS